MDRSDIPTASRDALGFALLAAIEERDALRERVRELRIDLFETRTALGRERAVIQMIQAIRGIYAPVPAEEMEANDREMRETERSAPLG